MLLSLVPLFVQNEQFILSDPQSQQILEKFFSMANRTGARQGCRQIFWPSTSTFLPITPATPLSFPRKRESTLSNNHRLANRPKPQSGIIFLLEPSISAILMTVKRVSDRRTNEREM